MDIMELGAIGELVGGVAVIGSLVFVGLQIRQSTRMTESSMYDRASEAWPAILQPAIDQMDLFVRGAKSYEDLDEEESLKFGMILANIFVHHENFYLKYQAGLLAREQLDRYTRLTTWYLLRPGIAEGFWRDYRLLFTETFARHVDSTLDAIARGEMDNFGGGTSGLRTGEV